MGALGGTVVTLSICSLLTSNHIYKKFSEALHLQEYYPADDLCPTRESNPVELCEIFIHPLYENPNYIVMPIMIGATTGFIAGTAKSVYDIGLAFFRLF